MKGAVLDEGGVSFCFPLATFLALSHMKLDWTVILSSLLLPDESQPATNKSKVPNHRLAAPKRFRSQHCSVPQRRPVWHAARLVRTTRKTAFNKYSTNLSTSDLTCRATKCQHKQAPKKTTELRANVVPTGFDSTSTLMPSSLSIPVPRRRTNVSPRPTMLSPVLPYQ